MIIITLSLLMIGCASAPEVDSTVNYTPIPSLNAGVNEFTLEQDVAGVVENRRFLVHTAEGFDGSGNTPLFFGFHGNGGVPDELVMELGAVVEEEHFVAVYPEGMAYSWNLGPEESEADDVVFVEGILAMLRETEGIDASKPVAMGFSNGAGMAHELAMESEQFVGIAPVISHMLVRKTPGPGAAKVSVLQLSGTEDELVPYDGGVGVLGHEFLAAEDSSAAWAAHNGCDDTPSERASGSNDILEWGNCSSGQRVVHVRMNGVGHDMVDDIDGGTIPWIIDFLLQSRQ